MLHYLLLLCTAVSASATVAFRIAEPDLVPEGIAYDAKTRTFFVGSTFKRKIVAVDTAGAARDFTKEAQDGQFGILGLRVDHGRRRLWAISSNAGATMPARALDKRCLGCSTVTSYDIDSGRLVRRYELPNTPAVHFLNDLAIAPSGDVFITDTVEGAVYRIGAGKETLERWIQLGEQSYPNGIDITPDGGTLYVATAAGIRRISVEDGSIAPVESTAPYKPASIDGLYVYGDSLVAIQPFEVNRRVMRYVLSADGRSITRAAVLVEEHPFLKQPTTGTIVGDDLYFIANAQLQIFRVLYKEGAGTYDPAVLDTHVLVLRTPLDAR